MPSELAGFWFLFEHNISFVSNQTRNIIVLGWTHGWVNQNYGTFSNVLCIKSSSKQLVMRAVDGIATLESDDILSFW